MKTFIYVKDDCLYCVLKWFDDYLVHLSWNMINENGKFLLISSLTNHNLKLY